MKERPLPQPLPHGGVDSHAHLDSKPLVGQLEDVLQRAREAGISHIGQVFLSPAAYEKGKALFAQHPEVFYMLGIHPSDWLEVDESTFPAMRAAFQSDSRLRALGEIGLDFHWPDPPAEQLKILLPQLDMALELDLRVVIHCREAMHALLPLLDERGFRGRPLLWHCFTGTPDEAQAITERGWHLSVPGPVTYPANGAVREMVRTLPLDRLLLETDCPYLSPQPWRGTTNEPAYTTATARVIAEVRGMEVEELWRVCGDNARRFFGVE